MEAHYKCDTCLYSRLAMVIVNGYPAASRINRGGLQLLEEEDRKEIIKLQEATHTSVIAFVLSLFIPLIGLILGIKAKSEIDKSEHTKSGSAFAVAAIWIGAIGTLAWAAILALVVLVGVNGHGHGFGHGFGDGFGHRGIGMHQRFGGFSNQQQPGTTSNGQGMMPGYGFGNATPNSAAPSTNG